MATPFDRRAYELPVLDLGEAIELATALLRLTPSRSNAAIAEEAARMAKACARAKTARTRAGGSVDARAFDAAMDRAWEVFVRRIQDHAELATLRGRPSEAPKVYAVVHDLSILQLNYLAEFAQIGARLDALKREGLLEEARELAGAPFLDEVLRCHAEYGEAIGATTPAVDDDALHRGAARLELVEALREYTYQVLAIARPGKPATFGAALAALAPITELHAGRAAQRSAPQRVAPRAAHPPVVATLP